LSARAFRKIPRQHSAGCCAPPSSTFRRLKTPSRTCTKGAKGSQKIGAGRHLVPQNCRDGRSGRKSESRKIGWQCIRIHRGTQCNARPKHRYVLRRLRRSDRLRRLHHAASRVRAAICGRCAAAPAEQRPGPALPAFANAARRFGHQTEPRSSWVSASPGPCGGCFPVQAGALRAAAA
jgi:hypothetical protein